MRSLTKELKAEYEKDVIRIYAHNNSKNAKRTPEQKKQAHDAKVNFYLNKWNALNEKAETPAQKNYCETMIDRIKHMPKYY